MSPYLWTPCSSGINDEEPKTTKAPAFRSRQRGVLSMGCEIRTPVIVPVVKIWNSMLVCQLLYLFDRLPEGWE